MKLFFSILLLSTCIVFSSETPKISDSSLKFIEKFCIDCHDSDLKKGDLDLSELSTVISTPRIADHWYRVLNSLNAGEMPPPKKKKQPTDVEKAKILEDLSAVMVKARKYLSDSNGKVTIRRMSKDAYINSMYDLLGVRIDASKLPKDRYEEGYDTYGEALYFSPTQLLEYKVIARGALEELLLSNNAEPVTLTANPKDIVNKRLTKLISNAERSFEKASGYLADSTPHSKEKQKKYGYENKALAERWFAQTSAQLKLYKAFKEADIHNIDAGILSPLEASIPVDLSNAQPGKYRLTFETATNKPGNENYLAVYKKDDSRHTYLMSVERVTESIDNFQQFTVYLDIKPNIKSIIIRPADLSNRFRDYRNKFNNALEQQQKYPDDSIWLRNVTFHGPLTDNTKINAKNDIFFHKKESQSDINYVADVISLFYNRVTRGKTISKGLTQKLLNLYNIQRASGQNLESALIEPLSIILALPEFLYFLEPSTEQPLQTRISDLQLASRLSILLWNSIPDKELISLAERNLLSDEKILSQQIDRMLKDKRCDQFIESFCSQWLHLERLDLFQFEARYYDYFEHMAKKSAREEVLRTFKTVLNEGLSVDNLLLTDFMVIDKNLANHYGIKDFTGDGYQKISVPKGSRRGGLLTMAATLAMGSDGVDSSPVERGAWILRKLLNKPPPPAPADIPALQNDVRNLSKRDILLKHTKNPQCSQCHSKIDPLGLALEDFDASGRIRTAENDKNQKKHKKHRSKFKVHGKDIKTDVYPFSDFNGLREYIDSQRGPFVQGFIKSLVEYSLGRESSFSDQQLLEDTFVYSKKNGHKISEIIKFLVKTKEFNHK